MEHGNQIVGRVVSRLLKRKSTILFLREEFSIFIFRAMSGNIL